jgi:hypothetical protein
MLSVAVLPVDSRIWRRRGGGGGGLLRDADSSSALSSTSQARELSSVGRYPSYHITS